MANATYPVVHATLGPDRCAACGKEYPEGDAPVGVGRDTTGALNSLHFSCEVASGVTLHLCLPLGPREVCHQGVVIGQSNPEADLEAAWPGVLAEVKAAVLRVKADEKAALQKRIDALSK